MSSKEKKIEMHPPEFNAGGKDELNIIPVQFWDTVFHRYFPVLSLTYLSSALGVAFKEAMASGQWIQHILYDRYPYDMALWVGVWVSIPAVFWIFMRYSVRFAALANIWYKVVAGMMGVTAILSLILFPEWDAVRGVRIFFVASIPIFTIQYFFFVKGGLPPRFAWPLTVAGLVFMLYGTFVI